MGYNAVLTQEFPELFEGAFVKMRNPRVIPWGVSRAIREEAPQGATDEETGRFFLSRLILDWNLPDVDDPDGPPLPIPPSPADLDRIPADVYVWLAAQTASPNGKAPSGNRSARRSRGKRQ